METILAKAILANHIEETRFNVQRCIHCLVPRSLTTRSLIHEYSCPVNTAFRVMKKLGNGEKYPVDSGER